MKELIVAVIIGLILGAAVLGTAVALANPPTIGVTGTFNWDGAKAPTPQPNGYIWETRDDD